MSLEVQNQRSILNQMVALQGKSLNKTEAIGLQGDMNAFLLRSIKGGLEALNKETPESGFEQEIAEIASGLQRVRSIDLDAPDALDMLTQEVDSFIKRYESLYASEAELSPEQKLVGEYLIGLSLASVSIRAGAILSKRMGLDLEKPLPTSDNFIAGFEAEISQHKETVEALNRQYEGRSGDYFNAVLEHFRQVPALRKLTEKIVSMRFIPESPEDKGILALAQSLHWRGFGGPGELMEEMGLPNWMKEGRIGWKKMQGENPDPFTVKLGLFLGALLPMEAKEIESVVSLVSETFPGKPLKVMGIGVGGSARKEVPIIKGLKEKGGRVEKFVATDADPDSLVSLQDVEEVDEVRKIDVNGKMPEPEHDEYHLVTASIVLHQIADKERGHEQLKNVLSFVTASLMDQGIFDWSDAGEDIVLSQLQLIPFNVVDREGSAPLDVYNHEDIKPSDTAVESKENEGMFKVLMPCLDHRTASPAEVADKHEGKGMYQFVPYQVVTVDKATLNQLDAANSTEARDEIITAWKANEVHGKVRVMATRVGVAEDVYEVVESELPIELINGLNELAGGASTQIQVAMDLLADYIDPNEEDSLVDRDEKEHLNLRLAISFFMHAAGRYIKQVLNEWPFDDTRMAQFFYEFMQPYGIRDDDFPQFSDAAPDFTFEEKAECHRNLLRLMEAIHALHDQLEAFSGRGQENDYSRLNLIRRRTKHAKNSLDINKWKSLVARYVWSKAGSSVR